MDLLSKEDVQNFRNLLRYFKQLAFDGVIPLIEKQLLLMLDNSLPFFTHLILEATFQEIHRLTINRSVLGKNKRINEIKYLKYPPKELVTSYGRCNKPGQPVFYGGFSIMTILAELRPRKGDLVTHSIWRVKNKTPLKFCPIFKNQPSEEVINTQMMEIEEMYNNAVKDYPIYLKDAIDELHQFIADSFTKRVDPRNHLDYIFSAYFSDKILHELDNGRVDAIYYPSVQEKLSFENIAIKPEVFDEKYDLVEVSDQVIEMDPSAGRGGYFGQGLSTCKSFDYSPGRICWETTTINQPKEKLFELKLNYGIEID
jgi:hypothetical protein